MANATRVISCNQQLLSMTFDLDTINQTSLDCVFNDTFTDDNSPFFFYEKEQLAFLWILLILIVVGNISVLLGLAVSKARKSRMNYFIKHLALADLTVGAISVLTDIVWKMTVSWHAGNVPCKLIRFSQALVTYSSTYVLVALSIDRYDAIRHPLNFSRGWRRARVLVGVAWLLSAVFSIPSLVLYEESWIQDRATRTWMLQCWIDLPSPWQWQLYITLVAVGLFFLPAIIISACYVVIVRTIWAQSVALTTCSSPNSRPRHKGNGPNDVDDDQESRRASSRGIIPRAKIKTVKMTFVIVSVFILCWSPYIVFDLLQVYDFLPKSKTMTAVATFVQSLAPLNSAANPLIYCLFSTHLCKNIRKTSAAQWIARKLSPLRRHFTGNACATDTNVKTPSSGKIINNPNREFQGEIPLCDGENVLLKPSEENRQIAVTSI